MLAIFIFKIEVRLEKKLNDIDYQCFIFNFLKTK